MGVRAVKRRQAVCGARFRYFNRAKGTADGVRLIPGVFAAMVFGADTRSYTLKR
jgi:hypothetical protein